MARQSTAGEISRSQLAAVGRIQPIATFEWTRKGDSNFLNYIGNKHNVLKGDQFSLLLDTDNASINELIYAFEKHVTGFMSIDGFIELLRELGVSAESAEEVRTKIAENHINIKLSLDRGIGNADGHPAVEVSGNTRMGQREKRPTGDHSGLILRERQKAEPAEAGSAAMPTNWEEAKAQVPGLRKWVDVKREASAANPGRPVYDSLVEHLRNPATGLGKWTTSKNGMPRNLLRRIDSGLLQELYAQGNPNLPKDILLPRVVAGRPRIPEASVQTIDSEEKLRELRRVVRRAERASR